MSRIDYLNAEDAAVVNARAAEDSAHDRYIKAVRHTGRTQGFLAGFLLAVAMFAIFG